MKVILLEDVYKKGVAGEIVDVAPGYAHNYLIPRKMAVKATPGAYRQLENLRAKSEVRRADRDKKYSAIAEKIGELKLFFSVKAGETGKLYGSVTPADIADRLKEEIGLEIDRRRIGDNPLRELGSFSVPVRLEAGLIPNINVFVYREGEDPREAEAAAIAAAEAEAAEAAAAEAAAELEEAEAAAEAAAEAEAEAEAVEEVDETSEA